MARPYPLTIPAKRQEFVMTCVFMGRKRALMSCHMDWRAYKKYLKEFPEESVKLDQEIEVAKAGFTRLITVAIKDKVVKGKASMKDLVSLMERFEPELWQSTKRVEHRHSGGVNLLHSASADDKEKLRANIIEVLDESRTIASGDATGSRSDGSKAV